MSIDKYKSILHTYITDVLKWKFNTVANQPTYHLNDKTFELYIICKLREERLELAVVKKCLNYDKSGTRHNLLPLRIELYQFVNYEELVLEHVKNYIDELDIFIKNMDNDIFDKTSHCVESIKHEIELFDKI